MTTGFAEGLVTAWVGRSHALATRYQLREPIDLPAEIESLVLDALDQSRVLGKNGDFFLAKLQGRLTLAADIAEMPEAALPNKLTDPSLNILGRAEALRAIGARIKAAEKQSA